MTLWWIWTTYQNVANWNGNIFFRIGNIFLGFFQFGNILVPDLNLTFSPWGSLMVQLFGSNFDPIGSLVIGPVFQVIADYKDRKFRNGPRQKNPNHGPDYSTPAVRAAIFIVVPFLDIIIMIKFSWFFKIFLNFFL